MRKQRNVDLGIRLGPLKPLWKEAADKDHIPAIATWVKVIVNQYISGELVRKERSE